MNISFEKITERDVDLLIMRHFATADTSFINLFINKLPFDSNNCTISDISHSVMTNDGESDIEVIVNVGCEKIALTIENKIGAEAQPEQARRYRLRGNKAVGRGDYDWFFIFIIAPQKYLDGNSEARHYQHHISYEDMREALTDPFDIEVIDKALDESRRGYVPVEDSRVTEFWSRLYDYIDSNFPNEFKVHGKRGESRGARAQWISIDSGYGTGIQIKCDRGYADLEISGYAARFQDFSRNNQEIIERKRLYVRMASKSLAIRKYIEPIDFSESFDEQVDKVEFALQTVRELQDLARELKF